MARAYLQRQGQEQEREPEPESARPDGPHRYRCSQKQGHQCHHHHPVAGDVHGSPLLWSARREQHQGGRWQEQRRRPME